MSAPSINWLRPNINRRDHSRHNLDQGARALNEREAQTDKFTIPARPGYTPVVVDVPKGATLRDAVVKAALTGADLTGAYLTGADLTRADLTGAYLTGADLTRADLTGAYLTGADLTRADLTGAYLTGADLRGAYLTGNKPSEGEADRPADQIQGLRGRAYRSDDYEFCIFRMGDGGLVIRAGCRTFTPDEFEAHIVEHYEGGLKATETRRIIAFLIEQANAEAWT